MNIQQVNALVGMSLNDAEAAVRAAGLKPQVLSEGQAVTDDVIPRNVVRLIHTNHIVVAAQTQESIDAKYSDTTLHPPGVEL